MWGSKTTLVDRVLRDCNVAITADRVMDRNELEKERGITIMSKVTSVTHGEHRINGTYSYGRQAGGGGVVAADCGRHTVRASGGGLGSVAGALTADRDGLPGVGGCTIVCAG